MVSLWPNVGWVGQKMSQNCQKWVSSDTRTTHFFGDFWSISDPQTHQNGQKTFFSEVHIHMSQLGPKTENRQNTPKNEVQMGGCPLKPRPLGRGLFFLHIFHVLNSVRPSSCVSNSSFFYRESKIQEEGLTDH